MERGFGTLGAHISDEVRGRGIWRGTLLRRRRDGTTFPAACTVVGLEGCGRTHHALRRRRARHHRRTEAPRSARPQRAAVGDRRAGRRRGARDQQSAPDHRRLRRADAGQSGRTRRCGAISRWSAAKRRAPVRSSATCCRSSGAARPTAWPPISTRSSAPRSSSASITCCSTTSRSSPISRAGPLPVLVNREEIQQIVLNLMLNAEQAILTAGRGSRITVRSYSTTRSSGPRGGGRRPRHRRRSCGAESSSRSSRRRTWGRARASACRFPTASRPRTAARWISVRENRGRASG